MKLLGIFGAWIVAAAVAWPHGAAAQTATQSGLAQAASRGDSENVWRYVWHNDRWWYWTNADRWDYFDGARWRKYDRRRSASSALAGAYRRAPAFESPPAVPPRSPVGRSVLAAEAEAGAVNLLDFGGDSGGAGAPLSDLPRPGLSGGASGARDTSGATNGGGAFGGPKGGSLGAGSAAGGASTPQ